jgi:RNA polymerase sigma-70 factor (ECF subfamily)
MNDLPWGEIYTQHRGSLLRFFRWRTGNQLLAEDLLHETFAKAIRSGNQWTDDGRGIRPWLSSVASSVVLDHFKRASTHRERPTDDMALLDYRLPVALSAQDVVLQKVERADQSARLRAALADLTAEQREVLVLQYWHGWALWRIGRHTYRSERAVNTMAGRARKTLRMRLAADP